MATKGTLKYRKVTRTPQSGPNKDKKMWYATAVTDREMDFEAFVTTSPSTPPLQPRHRAQHPHGFLGVHLTVMWKQPCFTSYLI